MDRRLSRLFNELAHAIASEQQAKKLPDHEAQVLYWKAKQESLRLEITRVCDELQIAVFFASQMWLWKEDD